MRTQKAKGVRVLFEWGFRTPTTYKVLDCSAENPIEGLYIDYPVFARPCPVRPRHGFVESRIVRSEDELVSIVNEVKRADPEGEILLQEPIDALYNVILTPGLMVIGPGNDGATAGKDAKTFPWIGYHDPSLYKSARITESPYFEIVIDKDYRPVFTQLRDGPRLSTEMDFIPREMKVKNVVIYEGQDLIAWESFVKTLPEGTVVYFPGGSLASHAAIHCVVNGLPVMTSRKPIVGEVLTPTQQVGVDPYEVKKGLKYGLLARISPTPDTSVSLYVLHNSTLFMNPRYAKYLGYGAAVLLRVGLALLLGEARHSLELRYLLGEVLPDSVDVSDRDSIYHSVLSSFSVFRDSVCIVPAVYSGFLDVRQWDAGYGGPAWAKCMRAWYSLYKSVVSLLKGRATQTKVKRLVSAYNAAVNAAHNNGWWLNKVVPLDYFNLFAKNDPSFVARVAPVLYELDIRDVEDDVKLPQVKIREAQAPKVAFIRATIRGDIVHLQVEVEGMRGYMKVDFPLKRVGNHWWSYAEKVPSLSGSDTPYAVVSFDREGNKVYMKFGDREVAMTWKNGQWEVK